MGNRLASAYGCPVEFCASVLGGKWKTVILSRVKQVPLRYGQLRKLLPELSDKVLTERLHDLEGSGLLLRLADGRYGLGTRGHAIIPVLEVMYEWGMGAAADYGVRFILPDIGPEMTLAEDEG